MLAVNCKQVGCPDLPQSEHETNSSGIPDFLFSTASPKQKSQYGDAGTRGLCSSVFLGKSGSSILLLPWPCPWGPPPTPEEEELGAWFMWGGIDVDAVTVPLGPAVPGEPYEGILVT